MKQEVCNILDDLINRFRELGDCRHSIEQAFNILENSFRNGGKMLACGNGGSAADCEHIVGELMKGFRLKRRIPVTDKEKLKEASPDGEYMADHLQMALPAISLVNAISLNTAFINDVSADMVYAQGVYGLGNAEDVLVGITTSGNSRNILNAVYIAKIKGMRTIGFTGDSKGKISEICDVCICVPKNETYLIQEYTFPIYHALCAMLEEEFFGEF